MLDPQQENHGHTVADREDCIPIKKGMNQSQLFHVNECWAFHFENIFL